MSLRMESMSKPGFNKEQTFGRQVNQQKNYQIQNKETQQQLLAKHSSPKLNNHQPVEMQQMRIFEQSPVQEDFRNKQMISHQRVKSTQLGQQQKKIKSTTSTKHKAQKSLNLSQAPLGDITMTEVEGKSKLQKVRDFDMAYNAFANELISKGLSGQADDKQNLLVTDHSISKFMSNKSRPMTPVDKNSLHNRLYKEAAHLKQSRDKLFRPNAKLEEEIEHSCTFQPNLNTSVTSQKRSKNQFLEDQFTYQQRKEKRLNDLQEAKNKQVEESKKPKLVAKATNEKIVEKLRNQSPSFGLNQSAFNSKIGAMVVAEDQRQGFQTSNSHLRHRHQKSCGDLHQFRPQINKTSQAIYEEKFKDQRGVAQKLYEDAKRRQVRKHSRSPSADRSLSRIEYSNLIDGSSSMINFQEGKARNPAVSASVNHTSQIIIQTKFRNEFETSLQYAFRQTKDIKLPQNDRMLIQKETFFHLMNNMMMFPEQSNKNYLLEEVFALLNFEKSITFSPQRSLSPGKNSPSKPQKKKTETEPPQEKYIDSQHVFTLLCAMFNLLDHSQTAQPNLHKIDPSFQKKQFGYYSKQRDSYLISQEEKNKIHNYYLPLILYRQEQLSKNKKPTEYQQPIRDFKPELDPVSVQIVRNMSKSPHQSADLQAAKRMGAKSRQEYLEGLSKSKQNSVKQKIILDEKKRKETQECTFKPKMQTTRRKGSPGYVAPGLHHKSIQEQESMDKSVNKSQMLMKELSKPRQRNHIKTSEEIEYEKSKEQLTFNPKLIAKQYQRMNKSTASISQLYPETAMSPEQNTSRNKQNESLIQNSKNYSQKALVKKSMENKKFSKYHVPGQKSQDKIGKKKVGTKKGVKTKKSPRNQVEEQAQINIIKQETPLESVPELSQSAASFSPLKQANFSVEDGVSGLRRSKVDLSEEKDGLRKEKTQSEQPILCMDVRVSATEQDQLLIYKTDTISKVISQFAQKHNLQESKVQKLREVITQQLQ